MGMKVNCLCVALLICLLSATGFSRALSLHEMATITGTCCSQTYPNDDCKPADLNTCVSCDDKPKGSEPKGCPSSGIKYSGLSRDLCDSSGSYKCYDDGPVNCTKNCDCASSGIVNDKKCDGEEKCEADDKTRDCRNCTEDSCDENWNTKPDETCR